MSRQAYVYLPKQLLFFWSPKCGNTSLGDFIFQHLDTKSAGHENVRKFLSNANSRVDFKLAWDLISNHNFTGIVLSRNPYNRAVSAYLNKFVIDNRKWIQKTEHMEGFSKRLLNQARKRSGDDLSSGCQDPCDYIPKRSYPLFQAREALRTLRDELRTTKRPLPTTPSPT